MNGTKIASKAKAQLANFMGKVFTHFSKPTRTLVYRLYSLSSEEIAVVEGCK